MEFPHFVYTYLGSTNRHKKEMCKSVLKHTIFILTKSIISHNHKKFKKINTTIITIITIIIINITQFRICFRLFGSYKGDFILFFFA